MNRFPRHAAPLTLCASVAVLVLACGDDPVTPTPFLAIDQPPVPATTQGLYSDQACGSSGCSGTTQQSTAENFLLSRGATLTGVTIWGVYFPNDDPVAVDNFTVILHADAAGVPGASVHTEIIAASRSLTGASFGALDLYQYVLAFQNPPQLAAGTYWAEIYNNTTGNTSNFAWIAGTLDGTAGVDGANSSGTTPGSVWNHPTDLDVAIRIDAH